MSVHFTRHARVRMAEMEVHPDDVEDLLRRPDLTRPAEKRGADECFLAVADRHPRLAVVYYRALDGSYVVVSVVWRTYERYER